MGALRGVCAGKEQEEEEEGNNNQGASSPQEEEGEGPQGMQDLLDSVKLFANPSNLRRHMRSCHNFDNRYECIFCSRAFSDNSNRKKHENSCNGSSPAEVESKGIVRHRRCGAAVKRPAAAQRESVSDTAPHTHKRCRLSPALSATPASTPAVALSAAPAAAVMVAAELACTASLGTRGTYGPFLPQPECTQDEGGVPASVTVLSSQQLEPEESAVHSAVTIASTAAYKLPADNVEEAVPALDPIPPGPSQQLPLPHAAATSVPRRTGRSRSTGHIASRSASTGQDEEEADVVVTRTVRRSTSKTRKAATSKKRTVARIKEEPSVDPDSAGAARAAPLRVAAGPGITPRWEWPDAAHTARAIAPTAAYQSPTPAPTMLLAGASDVQDVPQLGPAPCESASPRTLVRLYSDDVWLSKISPARARGADPARLFSSGGTGFCVGEASRQLWPRHPVVTPPTIAGPPSHREHYQRHGGPRGATASALQEQEARAVEDSDAPAPPAAALPSLHIEPMALSHQLSHIRRDHLSFTTEMAAHTRMVPPGPSPFALPPSGLSSPPARDVRAAASPVRAHAHLLLRTTSVHRASITLSPLRHMPYSLSQHNMRYRDSAQERSPYRRLSVSHTAGGVTEAMMMALLDSASASSGRSGSSVYGGGHGGPDAESGWMDYNGATYTDVNELHRLLFSD